MTAANILIYIALIGFVLFKKVQGQPMRAPIRLFGLPAVLIVLGFQDLHGGRAMSSTVIALTVAGAGISLGLGLLRGRADKVTTRDGVPFVQWGRASLALFAANIVAKLTLDLIAVATGGSASTAGKSLIFTLGLTLLGEAIILWVRTGGASAALPPQSTTTDQSWRSAWSPDGATHADTVRRSPAPVGQPEPVAMDENSMSRSMMTVPRRRERRARRHNRRDQRRRNRYRGATSR